MVVTDISNYFDSIAHELLMEYLSPLGLPRKAVGTLGRILEVVKPLAGHSPNPRIGIPVDEFDCARQLAHVFLFEHDKRIVQEVGEGSYVRWMDDQNIRADSKTHARKIVNLLTRSLSAQRLTLNAGKTQFLSQDDVIAHFQLDANDLINKWEKKFRHCVPTSMAVAKKELRLIWKRILDGKTVDVGGWDKVLKRIYAWAARVSSPMLDSRMHEDLIEYPHLAERIFTCLARRNRQVKLFRLFCDYLRTGESLFEEIEASFFEACLLLNLDQASAKKYRNLCHGFVRGQVTGQSGRPYGNAAALLCLYWLGAKATDLKTLFCADEANQLPHSVARAWLAVVAAKDHRFLGGVEAKLVGHPSDDVARLSRFLHAILEGTIDSVGSYRNPRWRWPVSGKFYDARAWLVLELISHARSPKLQRQAKSDLKSFSRLARTPQEKRILARVRKNLTLRP